MAMLLPPMVAEKLHGRAGAAFFLKVSGRSA